MSNMCGCGRDIRYSHMVGGELRDSCNKYTVCLTYQEQHDKLRELTNQVSIYKHVLKRIVEMDGEAYEYKAWAKGVLDDAKQYA